ncbi:hypothetical protein [Legionella sainthelensi]|uniref:Uncharacterized protein n=1 Tax=Legionella sainthelensi TaxID=28087 RepID=A0A2H5FMJ0_9GAMM|nr:hypothetical protein [Legionella sainthelensi]AUH72777.1 hypothetical protein CAB17_12525 [Legionella sainthelensi]
MKRKLEKSESSQIGIFKKKKVDPPTKESKVLILELYSHFENEEKNSENYNHEITGNLDVGVLFRKRYQQNDHFIYSLDESMVIDIQESLRQRQESDVVHNVTKQNGLMHFKKLLEKIETLILVAQGNLDDDKIAGLEVDAFLELLKEDLELEDQNLPYLEIFACKMGQSDSFRIALKENLSGIASNFITYTTLLSANEKGRVFIIENEDDSVQIACEDQRDRFIVVEKIEPKKHELNPS